MLRQQQPPARRRAIILVVVLAMLTLFAVVGITFAFYAQKSHAASANFRGSWQPAMPTGGPDVNPQTLFNFAFAQLIYDVSGDSTGVYSALRGHSLARTLYGFNDAALNLQPFNGTGRLHYTDSVGSINGLDDYQLINYTYFPADGFLRDPERLGPRTGASPLTAARQSYTGGANVNYTYPDLNSFFLGASRADGTQLLPSFHRPWLFGSLATTNPNWTNASGKYLLARPRPFDMDPVNFPYPSDVNGDVKNKLGAPGGNDSVWMDLGYPVTVTSSGAKFKPLFAWCVEDLDGKINLNTAGNLMGAVATMTGFTANHASNQGQGKWEVNPAWILNRSVAPSEWINLFLGNGTTAPPGRYGSNGVPRVASPTNLAPAGKQPRFFAQVDLNAADESNNNLPTGPLALPAGLSPFPTFPMGYGNRFQNGNQGERLNHALLYDYFRPNGLAATAPAGTPAPWDDRTLPASDMRYLLYSGASGADVMNAQVAQLCPQNFTPTATGADQLANLRRRSLVTTLSMDLNRMGLAPWLFDRQASQYASSTTNWDQPPSGPQVAFPALTQRPNQVPANSDFNIPGQAGNLPAVDWRAAAAPLEKVNLDTPLTPFPHQTNPPMLGSYNDRFDNPATLQGSYTAAQVQGQFQQAMTDRQKLALAIYKRLKAITGVPLPANPAAPTDTELYPLRWLGQLAVNIVDFIDEDEISTPFNFYGTADGLPAANIGDTITGGTDGAGETTPKYWVFGTELPPVILNEVLTEYQLPLDSCKNPMAGNFPVKVWAELYTPMLKATNQNLQPQDGQPIPFYVPANGTAAAYSIYDVVVANTNATNPGGPLLPIRDNVLGLPDQTRSDATFPATTGTVGNPTANIAPVVDPSQGGYLLIGPTGLDRDSTIAAPRVPANTPLVQSDKMQYQVTLTLPNTWSLDDRPNGVSVLLRRVTNPHLPPDSRVLVNGVPNPLYNPLMIVDYMEGVSLNNATTAGSAYNSVGKLQPYASDKATQIQAQVYAPGGTPATVQHTLGVQNNPTPAGGTDDWLVHLDRALISPGELLNVSGYRPTQLTHKFITSAGKFQHLVPWFDQDLAGSSPAASHRLYRLLAFLEDPDRASGIALRGRRPGMVNINTIWELEVLQALLDPQKSNSFTATDVSNVWTALLSTRTPGMLSGGVPTTTGGSIGAGDRPFLDPAAGFQPSGAGGDPQTISLATGQPIGRGLDDTLFRLQNPANPTGPRLFQSAKTHPYQQNEMLTKILSNLTTRSNVFAVWLTVGFFAVSDDSTNPVKLGAEIGAAAGTNIRHRFFALIDRTQIVVAPTLATSVSNPPGQLPNVNGQVATAELNQPKTISLQPKQAPTDPFNGVNGTITYASGAQVPWSIQVGTLLVIDRGTPGEEVVQVTAVNTTNLTFTAVFQREHAQGFPITMHGNPGPQVFFDARDPAQVPVVPYYAILQ